MWRHRNRGIQPGQPWTRQRLLLAFATAGLLVVAALLGVALAFAQVFVAGSRPATPTESQADATTTAAAIPDASGSSVTRELIAAAPMASLPSEAATRPDPALAPAPPLRVPDAVSGRGPVGVPVFPHTPLRARLPSWRRSMLRCWKR